MTDISQLTKSEVVEYFLTSQDDGLRDVGRELTKRWEDSGYTPQSAKNHTEMAHGADLRPNRTPVRRYRCKLRCLVCDAPGLEITRFANWPSIGYVGIVCTCECGFAYRVVSEMGKEDYLSDEEYYANISHNRLLFEKGRGGIVAPAQKNVRFCECGCGEILSGKQKMWYSAACRMSHKREQTRTNANKREQPAQE